MRLALRLHPDSVCAAVAAIDVDVTRPDAGSLQLCYVVTGRIDDLRLPGLAEPERGDALWQHTCFEAFLAVPAGGYLECNFSPSTRWAVYRFDSYRSGMRIAAEIAAPRIARQMTPNRLALQAIVALPDLQRDGSRLGLSAVIVERSGSKSYWALAHGPGQPDFHHPDCFACQLPPP